MGASFLDVCVSQVALLAGPPPLRELSESRLCQDKLRDEDLKISPWLFRGSARLSAKQKTSACRSPGFKHFCLQVPAGGESSLALCEALADLIQKATHEDRPE